MYSITSDANKYLYEITFLKIDHLRKKHNKLRPAKTKNINELKER